jgi:hypothetical protein
VRPKTTTSSLKWPSVVRLTRLVRLVAWKERASSVPLLRRYKMFRWYETVGETLLSICSFWINYILKIDVKLWE